MSFGSQENSLDTLKDIIADRLNQCSSDIERKIQFLEILGREFKRQNLMPPVVVGGCAVEIYTSGLYASPDMDILCERDALTKFLEALGFQHKERQWYSTEFRILIDWQGYGTNERTLPVENNCELLFRVIGINELIIERLNMWKFWQPEEAGVVTVKM